MNNDINRHIQQLPEEIYGKIAAGEVVESPSSIVKELVENSIDAQADSIVIEIKGGGKDYIRITDNGCGIRREEMELAFQRHATSKIKSLEELNAIATLGFRGEALYSIAAVSKVELISRTKEDKIGKKIEIHGGEIVKISDIGTSEGTTIIVRDLFFNTPARRKFLKKDGTEAMKISDLISKLPLAYPNIKVRFANNDKIIFTTNGKGDVLKNIYAVYGSLLENQTLLHVDYEKEGLKVEGYVSAPNKTANNRQHQIFFVNGRYIKSTVLSHGLEKAYEEKIQGRRFPYAYLFISIDPHFVDVNVHPNKLEIRFSDAQWVEKIVESGIKNSLNTKGGIAEIKSKDFKASEPIEKINTTQVDISHLQPEPTFKEILIPSNPPEIMEENPSVEMPAKVEETEVETKVAEILQEELVETVKHIKEDRNSPSLTIDPWKRNTEMVKETIPVYDSNTIDFNGLTSMGVVFGTYIVLKDASYLYLLDQHAGHERVNYEKLLNGFYDASEKEGSQLLLDPFVFDIPYKQRVAIDSYRTLADRLGFDASIFGEHSILIRSIPKFLTFEEGKDFLKELFENEENASLIKSHTAVEKLISKACKKSVKANTLLSEGEIKSLLFELSQAENPLSCPHGRPTIIKMTQTEVEKLFKRR